MLRNSQQVLGILTFSQKLIAMPLGVVLLLSGCEAPARSKPWRHKNRANGSVSPPLSPLITEERERLLAKDARLASGDVVVELRTEPGPLFPFSSSPTVGGRRIAYDSIYECLTRDDGSGNAKPWLAERVADWGREIRIRLRPGTRFHDGSELTAKDVQFSFDMARRGKGRAPHLKAFLSSIKRVQVLSSSEVVLRLSRSDRYAVRALSLVPIVKSFKDAEKASRVIIGTGPYRLMSRTSREIVLERFSKYWGALPLVPKWSFVIEPDGAKSVARLRDEDADVVADLSYTHAGSKFVTGRAFTELTYEPSLFSFVVFNMSEGALADIKLRRAVAKLIDQKRIVSEVFGGYATERPGPIWNCGPINGPEFEVEPADPKGAERLLDEVGWVREEAGQIRTKEGRRLVLTVLATDTKRPERDMVVDALRSAGFFVDLRVGSASVLKKRLKQGSFHLAFVDWNGASDRPAKALFGSRGSQNWSRLRNREVDRLLDRLSITRDDWSRLRIAEMLHDKFNELVPFAPLPTPYSTGAASRRLEGVPEKGWLSFREVDTRVAL